jgi:hypothetical protein
MKKIITLMLAVLSIIWLYTIALSLPPNRNWLVLIDTQTAIDYLYNNGLTKFGTLESFGANRSLRRDEAAAFFARFARDVLGMVPDTNKSECNSFSDLSQGHYDLQGEMIAACQLWLMRGSNGKFMPTASFSNAHAITVIVRLLDGDQPETGVHWASNYLARAKVLWLTSGLSADSSSKLDTYITRGEVARLIEAWSIQGRTDTNHNQEGWLFVGGYIEWSLNYPSDFIPPDMVVCAEDINTQQAYCTNQQIQGSQYSYGVWFKIEVPVWSYYIYQYPYSAIWNPSFRWYYSEAVACWLMVSCPSNLISVPISQWETISDINPRDRNQGQ